MKKIFWGALSLIIVVTGCAEMSQNSGNDITVMSLAPNKNCLSMGDLSSSTGSGSYQVKSLKNRAIHKGANAIIIKSQKNHFYKKNSSMQTTTTVEIFRCS